MFTILIINRLDVYDTPIFFFDANSFNRETVSSCAAFFFLKLLAAYQIKW